MLTYTQIQEAIEKKEIEIFYSFKKKNDTDIEFVSDEFSFKDSEFKSNLYSNRLKLTLGPVVKRHKNKSFNSKLRFKGFSNYVDMRNNSNTYILKPKESITILTNERISLNGNYSAIILPKVSRFEVGIVVTPAYIDPYYDGILRLLITNTSESSFPIKVLETIAQCYFFRFSEEVPVEFKRTFARKSRFYGLNWQMIINNDADPFPVVKNPSIDSPFTKMAHFFKNIWYFLKENSLSATIILVLVSFIGLWQTFNKKQETLIQEIGKNTPVIEQLKNDFRLEKSEIIIKQGEKIGYKEIKLKTPKREIISILCPNDLIKYEILSGGNENESNIIFSYEAKENVKSNEKIEFEYSIFKELK